MKEPEWKSCIGITIKLDPSLGEKYPHMKPNLEHNEIYVSQELYDRLQKEIPKKEE